MKLDAINHVAVLGLGTMGHGIAQCFAAGGYSVRCYDEVSAARESLHDRIERNLKAFVAARLLTRSAVGPILNRITVADTEEDAVKNVQFVTEAVREDLATKRALFARLERMVSARTILASNSSTFTISQSARKMKHPGRAIVTHWFNPPHIVPVVEVVPGRRTNSRTTRTSLAIIERIGKQAIHIRKEIPGFFVNRVQVALMREVWDLLDRKIASAADIDTAIRGTLGFRLAALGQLEVGDFGGLDVHTAVFRNLASDIKSDTEIPATVRKLVKGGHYGVKTGRGFYEYTPKSIVEKRSRRDKTFLALLKLLYPHMTTARK